MGDVNITILDNGFGGVSGLNDNLVAVIGCASTGTDYAITAYTDPSAPLAASLPLGIGPLPQALNYILTVANGATALAVKVPITTAGSVVNPTASPAVVTGATTASPVVITSTAHPFSTGDIVVSAGIGGLTGATGTYVVTKLTANTLSLNGTTGTGSYTSGGTLTDTGVDALGTGTSVPTVTGTIADTVTLRFRSVTGGTIGVTGITFQISYDDGLTYGPVLTLGTANTYATTFGGTLNFAAGTLVAGDVIRYQTAEPLWAIADVLTAIDTIRNSTRDPVGILLVGKMSSSDFASLTAKLSTLETFNKRYLFLMGNNVDIAAGQTDATWTTAQLAAFAASASNRIAVAAGGYRIPQPNTGSQQRRPLSWPAFGRSLAGALQVDLGRVKDGPLLGVTAPDNDGAIYHDERVNPGLSAGRFIAAKTILGQPGIYIDQSNIMTTPGSTFSLLQYRRAMDKACRITRSIMVKYLSSEVRVNSTTGFIDERDASAIETVLNSALQTGLVSPGNVSNVKARVSRNDNILVTKLLNVSVNIVPLGYIGDVNATLGFINPVVVPL